MEPKRQPRLRARAAAETCEKFACAFRVLPGSAVKPIVVAPGSRCHPHLLQRLLQVDDDLTAIGEGQRHHPPTALVIDISV